jgi:hypothetical protein
MGKRKTPKKKKKSKQRLRTKCDMTLLHSVMPCDDAFFRYSTCNRWTRGEHGNEDILKQCVLCIGEDAAGDDFDE